MLCGGRRAARGLSCGDHDMMSGPSTAPSVQNGAIFPMQKKVLFLIGAAAQIAKMLIPDNPTSATGMVVHMLINYA